jgi:uncharacterized protein
MNIEIIYLGLILSLVIIQSVVGVGVLVLGTPILLLLNFSLIDVIGLLLPVSITTSFLNLIISKLKKNKFFYNLDRLKYFFIICIPSVFIGLLILKLQNNYINFDYLVSILIIMTVALRSKINKVLKNLSKKLTKIILIIIGITHGITNSGGTLLSILLINMNKSKMDSRNEITLFYFFLALVQFIMFLFLFDYTVNYSQIYLIIFLIFIGVIIGNILIKITKHNIYRELIYVIALVSSISLIIKNII